VCCFTASLNILITNNIYSLKINFLGSFPKLGFPLDVHFTFVSFLSSFFISFSSLFIHFLFSFSLSFFLCLFVCTFHFYIWFRTAESVSQVCISFRGLGNKPSTLTNNTSFDKWNIQAYCESICTEIYMMDIYLMIPVSPSVHGHEVS
jgi:hypothetical protein